MKLLIDNLDGLGPQDYTTFVDSSKSPSLVRKLNSPAELKFGLVAATGSLTVPVIGGRVRLTLSNGNDLFTGYIVQTPTYQYLGRGDRGSLYRYDRRTQRRDADGSEGTSPTSTVCGPERW